jgi:3-oxoacyl-[acyl-carrier-protein] synthase-3
VNVGICGTGSALGSRILTNAELCQTLGVTEDWVVSKTGIHQRRIAAPGETVATLALQAAQEALSAADVSPAAIGLTIVCTFSSDYLFPPAAMRLHRDLGMKGGYAYDLQANCSGPVMALVAAADRLRAEPETGYALVVGAEVMSQFIDYHDSDTATFLSDGAGAVVLGPSDRGLVSNAFFADTSDYEAVRCIRGELGSWPTMEMYGMTTGKQAVKHLPPTIRRALAKAGWTTDDVDMYVFHQANLRLIEFLMRGLKQPMNKTYTNVAEIGNTGAASLLCALDGAMREDRIKPGAKVVLAGVGAGFGFGASCLVMP